jgi:DNA-binding NtrC family response regulator
LIDKPREIEAWAGAIISFFSQPISILAGFTTMRDISVAGPKNFASRIPFPFDQFIQPWRPYFNVAIVSADRTIGEEMARIIEECGLRATIATGLSQLKSICSGTASPIACLCGLELTDGTFRDVVDYLEEQPVQIPVMMVSAPAATDVSSGLLESLKGGAFATICYPYRVSEVQVLLWSVIQYQREFRLHAAERDTEVELNRFASTHN